MEAVTDSVEDPKPETEVGVKLAVAPEGNPATLRRTSVEIPVDGVTFTE